MSEGYIKKSTVNTARGKTKKWMKEQLTQHLEDACQIVDYWLEEGAQLREREGRIELVTADDTVYDMKDWEDVNMAAADGSGDIADDDCAHAIIDAAMVYARELVLHSA